MYDGVVSFTQTHEYRATHIFMSHSLVYIHYVHFHTAFVLPLSYIH